MKLIMGYIMCGNKTILILMLSVLTLITGACSTVRDVTDWVPGVDSNEEILAAEEQKAREKRQQMREKYADKSAFAPTGGTLMNDAEINVAISQRYSQDDSINRADIGIEVNNSIVTLTGSVASSEMAVRVIAIAKDIAGVSRVISKLMVISLRNPKSD
jgi:osmotically-inducible protein OsmY